MHWFVEVLQSDSAVCLSVCQQGRWTCESLSVPGVCAMEEGSHFTTFDGKEFTFHGNCYYILSKVSENTLIDYSLCLIYPERILYLFFLLDMCITPQFHTSFSESLFIQWENYHLIVMVSMFPSVFYRTVWTQSSLFWHSLFLVLPSIQTLAWNHLYYDSTMTRIMWASVFQSVNHWCISSHYN